MKHENCLLKLGIKRTMQKKSTSTDFLPLNLNNETYLYRDWVSAELNMLNKKWLLKKDYIYDTIVNTNVTW